MTQIDLPESLTAIGNHAFYHCTGLTSVTIPKNVTTSGNSSYPPFNGCTNLVKAVFAEGMTVVPKYSFKSVSLLTVVLPESLTGVGTDAIPACDDQVVYGYAGTFAEQWAADNDRVFVERAMRADLVTLSWTSKVFNGAAQKPAVTVCNSRGDLLTENTDYKVSYSAGCLAAGTYTVTVSGYGDIYTRTAKKTFKITPQPLAASRVTLSWTSAPYNGAVQQPAVTVKNAQGKTLTANTSYTVSYSADSKLPGSYTVTVTGKGNYKNAVEKTYTITKQTLTDANVTLSWTAKEYNGDVQQPTVTVKNAQGSKITLNTSYTVSYSADSKTPGTYTVTVTGNGNYDGTAQKTYQITKQPLAASRVTLSWTSAPYNGAVQQPAVTVKNAQGKTLTANTSYTVSYSADSKLPGSYTVTVTGKGNYKNAVEKTYTITKQTLTDANVTLSWTAKEYNGDVQQPTVTVKNAQGSKITLNTSYTVSYSADSKIPGTYTVTVAGKGNYDGTVQKSYQIAKQTLTAAKVTLSPASFTYNGSEQQPALTVKNAQGKELALNGSYTVTWPESSKLPGAYTVKVTGKGYYTGTAEKTFTVKKQTLSAAKVTLSWTEKEYNGSVQKPTVTVKNAAGSKLTLNTSYTVSWSADSKYPGTYTVTVTGKGNYSGKVEKTYTIAKQTLTAANVTLSPASFTYNGQVQKPAVAVTAAQGTVLSEGGSYTVTWPSGCKAKGTYTVTVTGKGYYTGAVSVTFTIK